jgi:hypothetical protein
MWPISVTSRTFSRARQVVQEMEKLSTRYPLWDGLVNAYILAVSRSEAAGMAPASTSVGSVSYSNVLPIQFETNSAGIDQPFCRAALRVVI